MSETGNRSVMKNICSNYTISYPHVFGSRPTEDATSTNPTASPRILILAAMDFQSTRLEAWEEWRLEMRDNYYKTVQALLTAIADQQLVASIAILAAGLRYQSSGDATGYHLYMISQMAMLSNLCFISALEFENLPAESDECYTSQETRYRHPLNRLRIFLTFIQISLFTFFQLNELQSLGPIFELAINCIAVPVRKTLIYITTVFGVYMFGFLNTLDVKLSTRPVLKDDMENRWGFGQIMPMMMLLVFPLGVAEVRKDERTTASPVYQLLEQSTMPMHVGIRLNWLLPWRRQKQT
ncbi:hypothetical protein K440DRAFT_635929 [Wilcoxina mikolae CBS 423.85]|nr:hypothetical protein K440DRAFT_635929 [Wilcoxina mikolae CBS 423.85]